MKKILMLAMMVITMGLVGCGEMTAEEMEKEIVSIAEENGYEMIIIKKNDSEVESSTFSMRKEVETTPEPTLAVTATPTPFPTPTDVPTEESEDVNVTDEIIDNRVDPNTGETVSVYATPTPESEETIEPKTVKVYATVECRPFYSDKARKLVYHLCFIIHTDEVDLVTRMVEEITEEEVANLQGKVALIETDADDNGNVFKPFNAAWIEFRPTVYSYEFVE